MFTTLMRYVLKAAIRDRLVLAAFVTMIVAASLSIFLGSAAALEKDQFAVVFAAGSLRLAGIIALVLFVVFHVRRAFESKDIEFILSKPVGRVSCILAHSAAFSLLAILLAGLCALIVYGLSLHMVGTGHILWALSLAVENIIMVNVALFFALVLRSAVGAALIAFGLYVLARMMGQILGIIDAQLAAGPMMQGLEYIMQLISLVIPRLDLMGQTSWLIYGAEGSAVGWAFIAGQGAVFTALVLSAALFDLLRRRF